MPTLKQILIIAISVLIGYQSSSQSSFVCSTPDASKLNTTQQLNKATFEQLYQKTIKQKIKEGNSKKSGVVYSLPTVIHIIHSGAAIGSTSNPSQTTVQNIIDESNLRFRHQQNNAPVFSNPYYGVDTEIELCLASTDPNGNYTNGILRYYEPDNYSGTYNELAPVLDAHSWDKSQYLNIYICQITDAAGVYYGGIDIVMMQNASFWSGLTLHEVGHYLSLNHIFSSGCQNGDCLTDGDRVCDTPAKDNPGFLGGTCNAPANTCLTDEDDTSLNNPYRAVSLGGLGEQPDMLANYMDYTGGCWNAFTQGQKDRMRLYVQNNRASLLNSNGCDPQTPLSYDAGVTSVVLPGGCATVTKTPQITIQNFGTTTLTSIVLQVYLNGGLVSSELWVGQLAEGGTVPFMLQPVTSPEGNSVIEVKCSNPNSNMDQNNSNDSAFANTYIQSDGIELIMDIVFDIYPYETSWEIINTQGAIIANSPSYSGLNAVTEYICLDNAGCYQLKFKDSYGDGICCVSGNGSYSLKDVNGTILASGGDFTVIDSTDFCILGNDCIEFDLKLYLEGPYQATTGEMSNLLYILDKLPTEQPFNTTPWNYSDPSLGLWTNLDYPSTTVDWVLVSLRTDSTSSSQVYQTVGLLQKDGTVVFPETCHPANVLTEQSYFIMIEHRTHMGVMSLSQINIVDGALSYDFRLSDSYHTPTSQGQKQIAQGVYALFAGDINQSDAPSYDINIMDKEVWQLHNGVFESYFPADINLDSDANGEDKTLWKNNFGVFSGVPK